MPFIVRVRNRVGNTNRLLVLTNVSTYGYRKTRRLPVGQAWQVTSGYDVHDFVNNNSAYESRRSYFQPYKLAVNKWHGRRSFPVRRFFFFLFWTDNVARKRARFVRISRWPGASVTRYYSANFDRSVDRTGARTTDVSVRVAPVRANSAVIGPRNSRIRAEIRHGLVTVLYNVICRSTLRPCIVTLGLLNNRRYAPRNGRTGRDFLDNLLTTPVYFTFQMRSLPWLLILGLIIVSDAGRKYFTETFRRYDLRRSSNRLRRRRDFVLIETRVFQIRERVLRIRLPTRRIVFVEVSIFDGKRLSVKLSASFGFLISS